MRSTPPVILCIFLSVFNVINAVPYGFAGLGYPLGGQSYSVSHSVPHAGYGFPYGGNSYSVSHSAPHVDYGHGFGYGLGVGLPHIGTSVQSVGHGIPYMGMGFGYGPGFGLGHVSTSFGSVPHTGYDLGYGFGWPQGGINFQSGSYSGYPGYNFGFTNQFHGPYFGHGLPYSGLYSANNGMNSGSLLGALINKGTSSTSSNSDSGSSGSNTGSTNNAKSTSSTGSSGSNSGFVYGNGYYANSKKK